MRLSPEQYRSTTERATIVSIDHRNTQGLDFEPGSGRLVITDHGPSELDDPSLRRGGRRRREGELRLAAGLRPRLRPVPCAAMLWQKTIAPWGAAFVSLPGSSWTCCCVVAVVEGPDGALYVTTSNRDGCDDPVAEDDRILRIVPPA